MAKPTTIVARLGGRSREGSFNDIDAAEDWNFGDIGQELPFFGRPHDCEVLLVVEA